MNEDTQYDGPANLYDPDEITSFGKFLGPGRDDAQLIGVEAKLSSKRKWMLEAKFEIQNGENEGFERKIRYPLGIVRWEKNGRSGIAAGGIADLKRDLNNIGSPCSKEVMIKYGITNGQFTDQPDEVYATKLARIYNDAMRGKTVELHTVFDKDSPIKNEDGSEKKNDKGETMYWTKTAVSGLAGGRRATGSGDVSAQSKVDSLLRA